MTGVERIVIDCDPGNGIAFSDVDDGLALALALAHPGVSLEGVTIVAGNTSRELGYTSACELLSAAKTNIPVSVGARDEPRPDSTVWRELLDGRRDAAAWTRDFGATMLLSPIKLPDEAGAVDYLIDTVRSSPGEITVAALGPLTNVAAAIERDPGFARDVKRIAIMGGAFNHDRMPQELNFGYDPEAAHVVLASRAAVSLIPFDVTATTLLTFAQLESLDDVEPLQRFIRDSTLPWLRFSDSRFALGGCYLHDPLVIAALIDPSLVRWADVSVDVVLSDPLARGRPMRWDGTHTIFGGGSLELPDNGSVRVAESVNAARFTDLLIDSIRTFRSPITETTV